MLSTDMFEAPHTSSLSGFGFDGVAEVSWRMSSMSVCVLPVPSSYQPTD